jgi:ribosomal protein S12 methylthiotransferase
MQALIAASDYELSDQVADADVVVVNTCAFIQTATEASLETILDLIEERRVSAKRDRRRLLLVTGCLVNRYDPDELAAEMPEVNAFVPLEGEHDLLPLIERLTGQPAHSATEDAPSVTAQTPLRHSGPDPQSPRNPSTLPVGASAYLMIADGCDRACSYCTIPGIRGPYRSKTPDELVAETRDLLARGAREIVLIAQDTTAYGHDLPDRPTLATLVTRLCTETELQWLRLMYLQPEGVSEELIDAVACNPQVVHSFEMPLQHVSARILRAMKRAGSKAQFEDLIAGLRQALPDLALRTTLITGFPAETEEEFHDLLDFVEQMRFDYVGVFPFSPEDGTPAAKLPGQLDEDLRLERAQKLRDRADSIGWERAAAHVGEVVEVLV